MRGKGRPADFSGLPPELRARLPWRLQVPLAVLPSNQARSVSRDIPNWCHFCHKVSKHSLTSDGLCGNCMVAKWVAWSLYMAVWVMIGGFFLACCASDIHTGTKYRELLGH